MAATLADLGARVLRRLGVSVVAVADRPAAGATASAADIALRALRLVGINPIAAKDQPTANAAPVTQATIATRALQAIGAIAPDETPTALDLQAATDKVLAVHEALNALGLVPWTLAAIPARAAEHYVIMTAQLLGPAFGKPGDMALFAAAQEVLRLQALSGPRAQSIAEEKVAEVHDALNAQGIVSWPLTAIPQAVVAEYAALAANLLAPVYGKPGADVSGAEARIRKASLLARAPEIAAQAVLDVHTMLDARGKIRWGLADLPDYAEGPYVMLAANVAAPFFGLPQDQIADARAMRELAQVTSIGSAGGPVRAEYY